MRLEHKDIIPRPLEEVYLLVRDDLPKIVPFLPNVDDIKVIEYSNKGDSTHIVNHWFAKAEIPTMAKKFINKDLFSWKDSAVWNNPEKFVEYELTSTLAGDLYDAKGKNIFCAHGKNETELTVSCNIIIHPEKVPGVPKFLVKKVLPVVEEMLKKLIAPNIASLGQGLKGYFAKHSS